MLFPPDSVKGKMLKLLSDGLPHRREELHACLWDECGAVDNIQIHISHIRKALQPRGEDIVCQLIGYSRQYRWVRLLSNPYDGKR